MIHLHGLNYINLAIIDEATVDAHPDILYIFLADHLRMINKLIYIMTLLGFLDLLRLCTHKHVSTFKYMTMC